METSRLSKEAVMMPRYASAVVAALAIGASGLTTVAPAAEPTQTAKTAISNEASAALRQMGKTLAANDFSFTARTIRVYEDNSGQPLHIFHSVNVIAHRPDRLVVHATGDDGGNNLFYDGKSVAIVGADKNKYAQIPAPNTIAAMMEEVMGKLGVDFPLADFLAPEPNKAFLAGVTTGSEINTVTIDGAPYRHLFFSQPPGIELELWVDKTDKALPRRLIVTYRLLPGQPNFIAEFSDWNFGTRHPEAEFTFQPPAGATKVDLKPAGSGAESK
jgi:hypothetical protein